jgi:multimeric flavodoxin WrbA
MALKKLLIIYHSQSGNTRTLAQAVMSGAQAEEVELRLLRAYEACTDDLLWCDGVIFGTAEYLGVMSGGLKDFFDRTFYPAEPYQLNKSYAVFISAGNDGSGALKQLQRIVKGYPLRCVAEPIIVTGEVTTSACQRCAQLGAAIAAGLCLGIF